MRCYKILFGTFLLAFFSLVGFSSSVYAVEDITYTFDSSHNSSNQFCFGSACDDYKYILFSSSFNSVQDNFYFTVVFQSGAPDYTMVNQYLRPSFINDSVSYLILPSISFNRISVSTTNATNYPSDYSVTFTLTDTLPSSCPEPDPCPEPEQCPEASDTPYADKFDNIEKAIYTCGAILIMLYFFYCIYRMIIKGSGVN